MTSITLRAGTVLALVTLSACTVESVPLEVDRPVVIVAPGSGAPVKTTAGATTTTTTLRAPDGTTVVTSVSPAKPQGVAAFTGRWQAKDPDGSTCAITLAEESRLQSRRADSVCLGSKLMGVGGWQLRGSKVVLMSRFDEEIATLTQTEPNLLEGGGISMWR